MKKLVILLAILLVGVLVITGCSTATTTVQPTTTVAPPTTTVAPPTTTVAPPPTSTALTWEQALLTENLKKTITVRGQVTEVVPGWTTHYLVVLGAPYGEGLETEIYDPTLSWPGVTGTEITAFQSAWVGKTVEVTGKVVISDKASSLGIKRLAMLETSQIKVIE